MLEEYPVVFIPGFLLDNTSSNRTLNVLSKIVEKHGSYKVQEICCAVAEDVLSTLDDRSLSARDMKILLGIDMYIKKALSLPIVETDLASRYLQLGVKYLDALKAGDEITVGTPLDDVLEIRKQSNYLAVVVKPGFLKLLGNRAYKTRLYSALVCEYRNIFGSESLYKSNLFHLFLIDQNLNNICTDAY